MTNKPYLYPSPAIFKMFISDAVIEHNSENFNSDKSPQAKLIDCFPVGAISILESAIDKAVIAWDRDGINAVPETYGEKE